MSECPEFCPDDRIVMEGVYERQSPHQVAIVRCVHDNAVRLQRVDGDHQCEVMMHKPPFLEQWKLLPDSRPGDYGEWEFDE